MIPLVFVHGFMGGSAQWDGQVAALAGVPVIALDLPGYGKNAHLEACCDIVDFAHWALDELERQNVARFHLLGHSMGGMIAQEMAALAPDRVARLVLYGTGGQGVLPGRFETIETSKSRVATDGVRNTARRIAATWFLDCEQAPGFEACAAIAQMAGKQSLLAGLDAMNRWDGEARLNDIIAQTLVIWGDRDRTYPWPQVQKLWQAIPNTSLAVIPNCAHVPHLESPDVFNAILKGFVTKA